ncbi:MAG: hypothetical protein O7G86_07160 [Gammaproteobacteria bacterium]|nr:hypothetical protein [Gammaproteobacteria bacterium]
MSSAYSITRSVNTPRAVYLDFPLGHTAGKPADKALQRKVMIDTLSALDTIQVPGTIRTLPYRWADSDAWKDTVMRSDSKQIEHADDRVERTTDPQYQLEADAQAAELNLARNGCSDCIWPE